MPALRREDAILLRRRRFLPSAHAHAYDRATRDDSLFAFLNIERILMGRHELPLRMTRGLSLAPRHLSSPPFFLLAKIRLFWAAELPAEPRHAVTPPFLPYRAFK